MNYGKKCIGMMQVQWKKVLKKLYILQESMHKRTDLFLSDIKMPSGSKTLREFTNSTPYTSLNGKQHTRFFSSTFDKDEEELTSDFPGKKQTKFRVMQSCPRIERDSEGQKRHG